MGDKSARVPFWMLRRQSEIVEAHIAPLEGLIEKLVEELECAHEMNENFSAEIHVAGFHAKWHQVLHGVEVSTGAFDPR